jgi:hypothetical protein
VRRVLASTSIPFRPTTVQMPNLAQIDTKWITVFGACALYSTVKTTKDFQILGTLIAHSWAKDNCYTAMNCRIHSKLFFTLFIDFYTLCSYPWYNSKYRNNKPGLLNKFSGKIRSRNDVRKLKGLFFCCRFATVASSGTYRWKSMVQLAAFDTCVLTHV